MAGLLGGVVLAGTNVTSYVPADRNDSTGCDGHDTGPSTTVGALKLCPGSSVAVLSDGSPSEECSGHGECIRSITGCTEADLTCAVQCDCAAGWAGGDCAQTQSQATAQQSLRVSLLETMVRV